jgi:mRNA interferase RelE/StbE
VNWKIFITPTGLDCLKSIRDKDEVAFARIKKAIDKLADNPVGNGIKLSSPLSNFWRTRAGNYRIIYTIENELVTVTVIYAGHRKEVYSRLKKYLSR